MRSWRGDVGRLTLLLTVLTVGATLATSALAADSPGPGVAVGDRATGAELFARDCAVCHGPQGGGTATGPDITGVGTAGIDFVLRTGRMPIPHPDAEIRRDVARRVNGTPVHYDEHEIADIVAFSREWISGPEIPPVPALEQGARSLADGGELWRRNCAACHQLAGQGGILLEDIEIPAVMASTPREIALAVRAGPGEMPGYGEASITDEGLGELALYVTQELQEPTDPGGFGIGHLGPFAEGAAVWFLGVTAVLLGAFWIGRRT